MIALAALLAAGVLCTARAAGDPADPGAAASLRELQQATAAAPVRFRGRVLFDVTVPLGELSAQQRADAIEQRLVRAFAAPDLAVDSLRTRNTAQAVDVFIGPEFVLSVTDADAHPLGRTRRQLAADRLVTLRGLLAEDIAARSWQALLVSVGWSVVVLAVAAAAGVLLSRLLTRAARTLLHLARRRARDVRVAGVRLVSFRQTLLFISRAMGTLRWLALLIIAWLALDSVLMRFPWTQGFASAVSEVVGQGLSWAVAGVVAFLPNLLYLAIIVLGTRYLLVLLRFVMNSLVSSTAQFANFPPEWVQPTYQILRFFVIALALVLAFPYLPGSDSRAFQGVSVFVGVLLSLGSTAAIANIVAGIVLVYMRAIRPGERVRIGETTGDVLACELLAVKLRTIKNVDVAIPNVLALSGHILNYSRQAAAGRLILNTSVTIGYDAPWQQVEELLLAAARATPGVAAEPAPFVLRTGLDDFYVRHEVNVCTREAQAMARIYSDLHANILDRFHAAGVEIMSPHYTALRDGNRAAVPAATLPADYQPPLFGVLWGRGRT
jgi:small-conductance mechanosensitive channel